MGTNTLNKFYYVFLISFLLSGIFFSCAKKESKENTASVQLSQEQMITIMTDMHILEAALSQRRNRGQSTNELKESWYKQLFEKYDTTADIFEENLSFYNEDPAVMEKILEEVMANLSQLQSELDTETEAKTKRATRN